MTLEEALEQEKRLCREYFNQQCTIQETYQGCLIEVRSQYAHWQMVIEVTDGSCWQWSWHEFWHEFCQSIGRRFVNFLLTAH
jgi:hypothetical protein